MKSYTDLEQSRKLAEILPIESADMFCEKKSTWSEEDEYIIEEIEAIIDAYVLEENNPKALKNWLKSLKERMRE
jgi:hypothetical protein